MMSLLEHLHRRERFVRIKIISMLVGGGLLSLVIPALVTGLLFIGHLQSDVFPRPHRAGQLMHDFDWRVVLLVVSAVLIPLSFLIHRRTRGRFFEQYLLEHPEIGRRSAGLYADMPFTMTSWDWDMRGRQVGGAAFVEALLIVPALMTDGWSQFRVMRMLRIASRDRAAQILELLSGLDSGIDTIDLLRPGESQPDLVPPMAYLVFHDWADVAKNGLRIWITTHARERLGLPEPARH